MRAKNWPEWGKHKLVSRVFMWCHAAHCFISSFNYLFSLVPFCAIQVKSALSHQEIVNFKM